VRDDVFDALFAAGVTAAVHLVAPAPATADRCDHQPRVARRCTAASDDADVGHGTTLPVDGRVELLESAGARHHDAAILVTPRWATSVHYGSGACAVARDGTPTKVVVPVAAVLSALAGAVTAWCGPGAGSNGEP
jgi:hypothetical protein